MQTADPSFVASLQAAPDRGIAPTYFFWVLAKNRDNGNDEPFGLWTGDENIDQVVQLPSGGTATRTFYGGVNLQVDPITYTAELTDEPVSVVMSQIAPNTQQLVRGFEVKLAECEIYSTSRNGMVLYSIPQLQFVGIVDDVKVGTPEAGGQGNILLSVRSEIMAQLSSINPAKSSDSHQKRRQAGDEFSKYSGVIQSRDLQWYKE